MKQAVYIFVLLPVLSGCTLKPKPVPALSEAAGPGANRPLARPEALTARRPPAGARTAAALDTTTEAERAEAAAPAPGGSLIGRTVASLGDPVAQGFWLETPLVSIARRGKIVLPGSGASVEVDLRPIPGPQSAGSRISLAAMRLLGVMLTDLPELEVYAL
jgi:hypothetical protein